MNGYLSITTFLVIITIIITLIGFKNMNFFESCIFHIAKIKNQKQFYRLLTSVFLHADPGHLVFNTYSFYSFGSYLEEAYGIFPVLIIFLISALIGNILSLVLNFNKPDYRAVGASGGVCGIIFSSIFLQPGGSVYIFFIPIPIPAWMFAIIFILISLYGLRSEKTSIGHDAHLGGALGGMLISYLLFPAPFKEQLNLLCAILIPIVAVLIYFNMVSLKNEK